MKVNQILREGYNAYVLDNQSRQQLAEMFPPKFSDWIGHHVTVDFGVPKDPSKPYGEVGKIQVVGYASDTSLEALVVSVNGQTKRPDGKVYHITWSLDRSKGRKPVQSNDVIAQRGVVSVPPVSINAVLQYLN